MINTQNIRRAIRAAMAALGIRSAEYLQCRSTRSGILVMLDGDWLGHYNVWTGKFVKMQNA